MSTLLDDLMARLGEAEARALATCSAPAGIQ